MEEHSFKWEGLPVVVFGTGGISREVVNLIEHINLNSKSKMYNFLGYIEEDENSVGRVVSNNNKVIASDDTIYRISDKYKLLGIVIPIGIPQIKVSIYQKVCHLKNIVFPNIIHPNVNYDREAITMGYGNILAAGVSLTCDIQIGNFNLINLNSTIGHDTKIGNYNVINPLSSISGGVNIKNCCLIGTGAKILQQLEIEDNAIVGAGSVVLKDVKKSNTVVGVPAKKIK